ncbi:MAG: copper resistance protein NlpE [Candidatus Cloacimonetes bacterium]|nr:copper resistance protein NlpE [Candidatus Cloacimonadota bacterium]
MKKMILWAILILIIIIAIGILFYLGRQTQSPDVEPIEEQEYYYDHHNARNSLDYAGRYSGVLPCADCDGILMNLEITYDSTFVKNYIYLGKGEGEVYEARGSFVWNETGNTITLQGVEGANQYFVSENYLIQLDLEGKRITGELADMYILNKQIDLE